MKPLYLKMDVSTRPATSQYNLIDNKCEAPPECKKAHPSYLNCKVILKKHPLMILNTYICIIKRGMLSEISTLNVQVCNMLNKKIIKLRDGNQLN